jgi:predicted nucleic acid-binding protein
LDLIKTGPGLQTDLRSSADPRPATPTATLDTNVVIDAVMGTRPAALALLRRGIAGKIDLAVTTRESYELTKSTPTGDLAAYLASLPVLPSPFVWGTSSWGEDAWGPSSYARPTKNAIDADHLEAHRASGRNYFITSDRDLLRLAERQRIAACTP